MVRDEVTLWGWWMEMGMEVKRWMNFGQLGPSMGLSRYHDNERSLQVETNSETAIFNHRQQSPTDQARLTSFDIV